MTHQEFINAMDLDNETDIVQLLPNQIFSLIELSIESDDDGTAALTAEVEDYVAVVVFSSSEYLDQFAEKMPDLVNEDGSLPNFLMTGRELMDFLPADFGVLFNPESDQCFVMAPVDAQRFKSLIEEASAE